MRSHYCGEVNDTLEGQTVCLAGWAARCRDHGGVIFIDLRDHRGVVQVVVVPDHPEAFALAGRVRSEYVLAVTGKVRRRPAGTENPHLASGQVEVLCEALQLLNVAETPPFPIEDEEASEELRLKYRYLDLRRAQMQHNLRLRARMIAAFRRYLDAHGFLEVETPMLTRATPEGARDYLVPSRTHPGCFFALPQSPQLFKQLLMVGGVDRYYQIARCFRDEDLRADRQPEFTQLDIETAFLNESSLMALMEDMVRSVFQEVLAVSLPDPFPRLSYTEAMRRFGSDKPDLRIALELTELTDVMRDVDFQVFSGPARDAGGRVAALRLPGGGRLTRGELDAYTAFVGRYGAKGLAYIKVNSRARGRDGLQSPIVKNLHDAALQAILERSGAQDGDLLFFGAGKAKVVNDALGALRLKLGHDCGLVRPGWAALWVVDFPMFEFDEQEKRWVALHHPFTAPQADDPAAIESAPGAVLSRAYDMVLNGHEIGGGSVRIHRSDLQSAVFRLLGIGELEAREKFGFLLDALRYGAPPHGGIAFGLDRLAMLMAGADSIREVIAFPKTQTAACPLTQAPAPVPEAQLRELSVQVRRAAKPASSVDG